LGHSVLSDGFIEARLEASSGSVYGRSDRALPRQPVHTVYGGAHLFRPRIAEKLGDIALKTLDKYASSSEQFASVLGFEGRGTSDRVYERVVKKLSREPVEDYRIDFEDGYGIRSDDEEDEHALSAGAALAEAARFGCLPPFSGIRLKPFNLNTYARSRRTLRLFLEALLDAGASVPPGFVVTLPKIDHPVQVETFAGLLGALEADLGLPGEGLRIELMIETPRSIVGADGKVGIVSLVDAGGSRVRGVHFGTYDYTALLGITAQHQSHTHPACDLARGLIQVSLGQTGIFLSDGATNILPAPVHRDVGEDRIRHEENVRAVQAGWRVHFEHVQRSLSMGYFQGWDLHPNQLVTRYAAIYEFFLRTADEAGERLRGFLDAAGRASVAGSMFDDAATGQGLLNFFLTGMNCGALDSEEVERLSGLQADMLMKRSFANLMSQK
jgi:hypothetical protein